MVQQVEKHNDNQSTSFSEWEKSAPASKPRLTKRMKAGWVLLCVGIAGFIGFLIDALVQYYYLSLSSTLNPAVYHTFIAIGLVVLFASLIPVGLLLLLIKSPVKKIVPIILFASACVISMASVVTGLYITGSAFKEYSTFDAGRWLTADANYRGLLIHSFVKTYDIKDFTDNQVKSLLGTADKEEKFVLETDPMMYGGMTWQYDLGFYDSYESQSWFTITFGTTNKVSSYEIVRS